MEKPDRIRDREVMAVGLDALNVALGSVNTLRFLALLHREPTDYVEISQRLYNGQAIEEIFERAKRHWKE